MPMPSELVQRLRNLNAHSGDPDTVAEAAQVLENLEGVCADHIASIARLTAQHAAAMQHIDRLEALCRAQAAQIDELSKDRASLIREADILREMLVERDAQLAEAVKVHMAMAQASEAPTAAGTPLTDEQARKVLAAVMEVQP